MRRQQHPWAASCGKQKQPQTPCVQTPTALFYPYVPLQPSSPQALLHLDLCVSHWPPQPVCLGRQQEGAGAELLSGSQVHATASQPAPPSPPGDRPGRSSLHSPGVTSAWVFHSNVPFTSELQFQDLTHALLPSRNRK